MYNGSHAKANNKPRIRMNKLAILFIAVVMLIGAVVGSTVAFLVTETAPVENKFTYASISTEIKEQFDGKMKSDVQVVNNGDTAVIGSGAHADTDVAAGEGLNTHGDAEEDGKRGLNEGDQRQNENRDDGGGTEGTYAVPVGVHGLVASLIALGDGQKTGSPQRAAHGNPRSKEGHDGVTQEADQIGTAGIEDNLLIRTVRGCLGNNFLRQYKVGEGDDVGRQRGGDCRQEEAPGREMMTR